MLRSPLGPYDPFKVSDVSGLLSSVWNWVVLLILPVVAGGSVEEVKNGEDDSSVG